MQLGRDFTELLGCFCRHGVEFLAVGGCATAVYAVPRYTKDLDLRVRASLGNGQRIVSALREFGFSSPGLTAHDFESPDTLIQLDDEPNRVDLLTGLKGLDFGSLSSDEEVRATVPRVDLFRMRTRGTVDNLLNGWSGQRAAP